MPYDHVVRMPLRVGPEPAHWNTQNPVGRIMRCFGWDRKYHPYSGAGSKSDARVSGEQMIDLKRGVIRAAQIAREEGLRVVMSFEDARRIRFYGYVFGENFPCVSIRNGDGYAGDSTHEIAVFGAETDEWLRETIRAATRNELDPYWPNYQFWHPSDDRGD